MLTLILFLVGLFALVFGAERLVDGAAALSKRAGLSDFLVGATVVAIGTSLPELVVSLVGTLQGSPDIALGNVAGSNIMNILLVLGLTAAVSPIIFPYRVWEVGMGVCFFITALSSFLLYEFGTLTRLGAFGLLAFYIIYLLCEARNKPRDPESDFIELTGEKKTSHVWKIVLNIIVGTGGLAIGGHLFVDGAVKIFTVLGFSEKFIAATVLAGGTSVPELITCLVASYKKKDEIIIGNILGSNIANIGFVLGVCGLCSPLAVTLSRVDLLFLAGSAGLLFFATIPQSKGANGKIGRFFGIMLLCMYAEYIVFSLL